MVRPRKYKNLKVFSASAEATVVAKFDQLRGDLSRGEFLAILIEQRGDTAQIVAENRALKRENAELRAYISKLEQRIEELESKLRTRKEQGPKDKVKAEIQNAIERFFTKEWKKTLANLMRALGHLEMGEALVKKAEKFLDDYFNEEEGKYISKDLGLIIEPVEGFGILASEVKRLEQ